MRIAILGAGSVGCVFGGFLARAGHDVTLVGRRKHVGAVRERGLLLETPDGERFHTQPHATADPREVEPVDAVLVLTKTYDAVDAARSIVHAVTPETWVVPLQNGLGHDRALATVFPPGQVVPGTTTVGGDDREDGRVVMSALTARGETVTRLGPPMGTDEAPAGVTALAAALTEAGLPTEVVDDTDVAIWTKVAMAATMGPVSAILKRPYPEVWASAHIRALIREVFDEIVAVAHAEGVPLDAEAVWTHCVFNWDNGQPTKHTSMSMDTIRGRRTEIDAFSGEIVRLAAEHGLAAPRSEALLRLVKFLEPAADQANVAGAAVGATVRSRSSAASSKSMPIPGRSDG